jgi:hypothetical protein
MRRLAHRLGMRVSADGADLLARRALAMPDLLEAT